MAAICRTPADAVAAGRQLVRDNGWRLSPTQAVTLAALIRPHLQLIDADRKTAS